MTAQTGRTVQDFVSLKIGSAASDMQVMLIDSLEDVGLDYPEVEMSAFTDAVKGVLIGKPDFTLEFSGPTDCTASTGTSTLLRTWVAAQTLLSFDVQMGIRHAWEATEPQFGYTAVISSNSGVTVTSYKENGAKYTARIRMIAGSAAAPAWGSAAETKPA